MRVWITEWYESVLSEEQQQNLCNTARVALERAPGEPAVDSLVVGADITEKIWSLPVRQINIFGATVPVLFSPWMPPNAIVCIDANGKVVKVMLAEEALESAGQ